MSQGGEHLLWREFTGERRLFLSTLPATTGQIQLARTTVAVLALVFLALLPFAKRPVGEIPAFVPIYQSAFLVCDLITAVLLFGQFGFLKSRALLVLASGYLFTAFMAAAHALTFPGLFAPSGLLGAGPQTTAWLYMFWHGGFPLLVIAYAVLKDGERENIGTSLRSRGGAVLYSVAWVLVAVCALTLLATAGQNSLPAIMQGNHYTPAMIGVVSSVWVLSLLALVILWRRRPHAVLDLWLMVVMCAWFFDIALAAVLNAGRFDLGFYAGRISGLLAASFVLIVLLVENGVLYRLLVAAHEREFRERRHAQDQAIELGAANKELEAFSHSVSHDLRAPLRAVDGYARMLEEDHAAQLDAEGRRLLGVVRAGAGQMGQLIDDLLEFSRVGRRDLARRPLDMTALARDVADEAAHGTRAVVQLAPLPAAAGDPALIRQVWINLVSNAVKYSSKRDDPRIELGGRKDAGENVYWVRDNGVGFDMRHAAKLFGVFQRLHRADEFPGTGVGLSIVHRVIERHGGRVWAEAQPGLGACFYFALPA